MFPNLAMGAPALTASPTFTVRLPWRKCAYQAKTFGAILRNTLLPPSSDLGWGTIKTSGVSSGMPSCIETTVPSATAKTSSPKP